MTGLDRAVKRETSTPDTTRYGRKPLVVMLEQGGKILRIKPKGTRRWFSIDYATIYREAIRLYARQLKEEQKAKRVASRG